MVRCETTSERHVRRCVNLALTRVLSAERAQTARYPGSSMAEEHTILWDSVQLQALPRDQVQLSCNLSERPSEEWRRFWTGALTRRSSEVVTAAWSTPRLVEEEVWVDHVEKTSVELLKDFLNRCVSQTNRELQRDEAARLGEQQRAEEQRVQTEEELRQLRESLLDKPEDPA